MSRFPYSNFQPFQIKYRGISFPTVEHLYQALKSVDPDDWTRIAALETAGEAKKAGRWLPLRPDWEEKKLGIMRVALEQKFAPGTIYHKALMASGDDEIVERNTWHDNFFGSCTCSRCGGRGSNHLGRMLMEIRSKYQQENLDEKTNLL